MVRRFSSDTAWEPIVGYSRAVAAGDTVYVSGCTSTVDGQVAAYDGDPGAQTRQAIANVESALAVFGLGLADVVRTRIYVVDISAWERVGRVHGAAFAQARPATSMVQVAALIDPRLVVEVEALAYSPDVGGEPVRSDGVAR